MHMIRFRKSAKHADFCRLLQTIADYPQNVQIHKMLYVKCLSFFEIFESANSDNFFYGPPVNFVHGPFF